MTENPKPQDLMRTFEAASDIQGISRAEYMELTKKAVAFKNKYPQNRTEIAEAMVSIGSSLPGADPVIIELKDHFYQLELPDAHIDAAQGLDVDARWRRVSELCDEYE